MNTSDDFEVGMRARSVSAELPLDGAKRSSGWWCGWYSEEYRQCKAQTNASVKLGDYFVHKESGREYVARSVTTDDHSGAPILSVVVQPKVTPE